MKRRKLISLFALLFSVSMLASCGNSNEAPASSHSHSEHSEPSTTSEEPSSSSAEHVHSFVNKVATDTYLASAADCTHPAKYYYSCSCGEAWTETFESGEPLGHSWHQEVSAKYLASEATCQSRAFYYLSCERCGVASTETFGVGDCTAHKFTKVVVSTETLASAATCIAPAYYYLSCEDCGEIDHEHTISVGDPLGHQWEEVPDTSYLISEASCLNKAVYHVSCTRCHEKHESRTFEYGSPLGHEFTTYVSNHDATCTADGTETAHCNHAGCEVTDTRVEAGSKLAHSLVEEKEIRYLKSAASCLNDAVYYRHCEDCDFISEETFEDVGSAMGHEMSPITGHCIHEGCEEKTALCIDVNYGDGSFAYGAASEDLYRNLNDGEKVIYDFGFDGQLDSTNFYFILRRKVGTIYSSNASVVAYDESGNQLNISRLQGNYVFYVVNSPIAKGAHIYVHVTLRYSNFENVYLAYATHQFTGLQAIAMKRATCVSPKIQAHITFDQAETLGKWINYNLNELADKTSFYQGASGTGHELEHYSATTATFDHPGLKEHWFCTKCCSYFLDPDVDEECAYEDLYKDTIYGSVLDTYMYTGRGRVITVHITWDAGETPIESLDSRYMNNPINILFDNNVYYTYIVIGLEVNNHKADILLRGTEETNAVFDSHTPKAIWID